MAINKQKVAVQLKDIKVDPLSKSDKAKLLKEVFKSYAEKTDALNKDNLIPFLKDFSNTVDNYITEYQRVWTEFQSSFKVDEIQKAVKAASGEYNKASAHRLLDKSKGSEVIAKRFLRTLEKGFLILEHMRTLLTQQKVVTEFTLQTSGKNAKIYRVPKSAVKYQLVFSTYGASGNNFVSLAYSTNVSSIIQKLHDSLIKKSKSKKVQQFKEVTGTSIYNWIMDDKIKNPYLEYKADKYKKEHPDKPVPVYKKRFDSKDAEIFNLLNQHMNEKPFDLEELSWEVYRDLRASMGGRGGSGGPKTTAFQGGDVGLIQDKLIQSGVNQVNYARQTLIFESFEKMSNALHDMIKTEDVLSIKMKLLDLFTATKEAAISDKFSKAYNDAAQEAINNLFDGIKFK